jgi:hypothetical protein
VDGFRCDITFDHNFDSVEKREKQDFISTAMMISPSLICSDYVSSSQNDSSWTHFQQFVLSILIYATVHWIVHRNFELLHSWIHLYVDETKHYLSSPQNRRKARCAGLYRIKDGRLVFLANQTNATQQSKVSFSQSDDKNGDSSISTSGSTIVTHLNVQKKDPRFSRPLKMWKKLSDGKNPNSKNSQQIRCCHHHQNRRDANSFSMKCNQSKRNIQQSSIRKNLNQYQRNPATFRNRIENAFDRAALWYFVERRLQKSR